MSDNAVFIVPVPIIGHGKIVQYHEEANYYSVKLFSPDTIGALSCSMIYSPGTKINYKVGDVVSVLVTMSFGGVENKYQGILQSGKHYILGYHDKATMFPLSSGQPFYKNPDDLAYYNKQNDAGMLATNDGSILFTTRGAVRSLLKPFGHGIFENMKQDVFQNYHRVISHNPPYLSKEYFGLFKGEDQDDKMTRLAPSDSYMCYKRFLTQSMDPSSWVSTCEGSWNPWVGANNDVDKITQNSNILYTKIINSGAQALANRITTEAGEEGKTFYNFRIDQIIKGEQSIPVSGGATPAISGNKFKCTVSEQGEVEIRAASQGIPLNNLSGFKLTVDKDGNLLVCAKGKMTFTHGDTDANTCGLEFDGKGGINIKALGGLTVNGKPIVSSNFIDFLIQHAADFFLSSAPGAPSPINPAVLPFVLQYGQNPATTDPSTGGGFVTSGIPTPPPIAGIQVDSDEHATT